MATLGDMLGAARRCTGQLEEWLGATDPQVMADLEEAAEGSGMTVTSYARMAVADFSRLAEEEHWSTLISEVRDANDPGRACLAGMIQWRMAAPACSVHSHSHAHSLHLHNEGTAHGGHARHAE